jgi:hypothetical protein
MFVKEKGIPRLKFVKFAPGKFLKKTKDHTQRVSSRMIITVLSVMDAISLIVLILTY